MGKLSGILRSAEGDSLLWHCPGCKMAHRIQVGTGPGPRWTWNGNPDKPTFNPSVLVRGTQQLTDEQMEFVLGGGTVEPVPLICHVFIKNGQIQFLADSTHELAGQTVPIPPFNPEDD